jgi:very-short-patch-repair endonuclease
MSLPEVLLWQQLRRRPGGYKFRRQFPTERITTDFACLERRLIIEVDGEAHNFGDQPRRDAGRDAVLGREGFHVMRIPVGDVLRNMDGVIRYIVDACSNVGPLHRPSGGSPPRTGGEL